jgi:hypothetical protein
MLMKPKQPAASALVESLRPRSDRTARSYAQARRRFLAGMGKPVSGVRVSDATNYRQPWGRRELSTQME